MQCTLNELIIERLREDIKMPDYSYEGDSGMDVYSPHELLILPGETVKLGLGLKLEIPQHPLHAYGYRLECQVRPRSGISLRTPLRVADSPGTIDSTYTGEIQITLTNTAMPLGSGNIVDLHGQTVCGCTGIEGTAVLIPVHGKIAQLVFNEVVRPTIKEGKVHTNNDRGDNGFGSTGI